jgi:glycosyltransferase involved in cell wall biosynthesis
MSSFRFRRHTPLKLLFLVNDDWYFISHRLQLARAARDAGAEVFVMTRLSEHKAALESEGFRIIPWKSMSARSINPVREARTLVEVFVAYRRFRPDIVHHIALKPAMYGGLACIAWGRIPSIQTIAGLGYLFTNPRRGLQWLRWMTIALLWFVHRATRTKTIFQNPDDREFFMKLGIVDSKNAVLIKSSGVNVKSFLPLPEPTGVPVILLASRMLWDKGVREFVEAAQELRRQGVRARFALAGRVDGESEGGVSEEQLLAWDRERIVEWWGYTQDVRLFIARSNVICLPSYYREGVPKILLEAAACGRAIITTDAPGCRETVRNGDNGLLVPPKDVASLVRAIRVLVEDPVLRANMAKKSREIVVQVFSEDLVIRRTLSVYRELLNGTWPSADSPPSEGHAEVLAEI